MRIRFNSLSRPRATARHFETVFPALGRMKAMDWAATCLGYRDWHDLQSETTPSRVPTPELRYVQGERCRELVPEDRAEFFERQRSFFDQLSKLVGGPMVGWDDLYDCVWSPTAGGESVYARLGKTGKGHPFFVGLEFDLFRDAERSHTDLATALGPGGLKVYAGVPTGFNEAEMMAKVRAFVTMADSGLQDGERRTGLACVADGPFSVSSLEVEFSEDEADRLATQRRALRFWAMNGTELAGWAVVTVTTMALSAGNQARVEVDVQNAAGVFLRPAFYEACLEAITVHVCEALERLCWMRVAHPEESFIEVEVDGTRLAPKAAPMALALVHELPSRLSLEGYYSIKGVTFASSRTLRQLL